MESGAMYSLIIIIIIIIIVIIIIIIIITRGVHFMMGISSSRAGFRP